MASLFSGLFSQPSPSQPKPSDHQTSADIFASTSFQQRSSPTPAPSSSPSTSGSTAGPSSPTPLPAASPQPTSAFDTLTAAYDPAKLHPMAGLGDKLDFLALDEDKLTDVAGASGGVLPSRGWTDDLCVGTGTTYVSGLAVGGLWGLQEGWTRNLGNSPSFKLRLNSILNGTTRRGTLLGNSLGVLAIFYNIVNSTMDNIRGKHDVLNTLAAGFASGAAYKCTAGLRPMLFSAGLMTAAAGAWSGFKQIT